MRIILFFVAVTQLFVHGPSCTKYERRIKLVIDRDSHVSMEAEFAKFHLALRRHLVCPGAAASLICPESAGISLHSAHFINSDKRCNVDGGGGRAGGDSGDGEVCQLASPLSILQSRCSSKAATEAVDPSRFNCTVDSNPRLYVAQSWNSSSEGGSRTCRSPSNVALSIAYFCRPKLHYLLVCAGTRRVAECDSGRRLAVVYARQTSRYLFPQGGTVCRDTVKSLQNGPLQACQEANVTDTVRRRCHQAGKAASSCALEPGPPKNGYSCAPHHLLIVFACVPEQFYTSASLEVSTESHRSVKDTGQFHKPASAAEAADISPANGDADVAQSDQGGGRQHLSAAAAAAAAAADDGAGVESQLRRGKQRPKDGNEKEDIILISATATVVGALLLATCIAFIVVVRLRSKRRNRRRLRQSQEQQQQPTRTDEVVCCEGDSADHGEIDDADCGLRHPALVAAASPVPPPPPPQLADDEEENRLGGGCYLLPSPPMPPPPPPQRSSLQQQLLTRCPSTGLASLSGSQTQVQKQQQQPSIPLASVSTTTASPPGSVSSADAGSGYASASSSGGGGVGGSSTVRFSQFSDLYFYQPNSCPSPMPPHSAASASSGGRQLEGVREEEPTVYTPRGVSYV